MSRKNKEAEREDRRKKVAANLLGGLTYRAMAEVLDVSIGTIASDVRIILGRWQREQIQDAEGYVQVELQRLDRAVNAIWNDVIEGKLGAIDRLIKIMERRCKLLGLDAPQRQEITGRDGGPIETRQRPDLSKLTDEQLLDLRRLITNLEGD